MESVLEDWDFLIQEIGGVFRTLEKVFPYLGNVPYLFRKLFSCTT